MACGAEYLAYGASMVAAGVALGAVVVELGSVAGAPLSVPTAAAAVAAVLAAIASGWQYYNCMQNAGQAAEAEALRRRLEKMQQEIDELQRRINK